MRSTDPIKPTQDVLDYLRDNFKVIGNQVIRNDGYKGHIRSNGYIGITLPRRYRPRTAIYAHHAVIYLCTGEWPNTEIDHWDWDKKNNSIDNLRSVKGNRHIAQFGGVGKGYSKWQGGFTCYTNKEGKRIYLGTAKTEPEAIRKVALARINLLDEWEEPFVDKP